MFFHFPASSQLSKRKRDTEIPLRLPPVPKTQYRTCKQVAISMKHAELLSQFPTLTKSFNRFVHTLRTTERKLKCWLSDAVVFCLIAGFKLNKL